MGAPAALSRSGAGTDGEAMPPGGPVAAPVRAALATTPGPPRQGFDVHFLALARDGRLARPDALEAIASRLAGVTDVFLFCPGWLDDAGEARRESQRFFAALEAARRPLGDRLVPLRVALHWPSRPFPDLDDRAPGLWPALAPRLRRGSGRTAAEAWRLLADLCAEEVPLGPEEEAELDGLVRELRGPERAPGLVPFHALALWMTRRRAGAVGERFGRERLAPLWSGLGARAPRLHLVGHSLGAKVLTAAVQGGVRPWSLTLLLAAFSAFAFARTVPGSDRPGLYHALLTGRRVQGPVVVLHSHDRAPGMLHPLVPGPDRRPGGRRPAARGQGHRAARARVRAHWRDVVATSALGVVGAQGLPVPRLELRQVQQTGLPRWVLVNVDGSAVVRADAPGLGAHRDIVHTEIGVLVLLAAGLLQGGPGGVRVPPTSPLHIA
jgi:hypothetical protein